jgi:HrpA-like RNA helicase
VVTQPRRIAATSLANRVASLRREPLGDSVGYAIGQQRVMPSPRKKGKGKVLFATTGWLLQVTRFLCSPRTFGLVLGVI